jgi:hypothetical protein
VANNSKIIIPEWDDYEEGSLDREGQEIEIIYSKLNTYCVYKIKNDDKIKWSFDIQLCPNHSEAHALYSEIKMRAKSMLSKKKEKHFEYLIISDLTKALSFDKKVQSKLLFSESINFLDTIQKEQSHFRYVFSGLIFTIITVLPAIGYLFFNGKDSIYNILVGCFFGSCGAFVSVLQRYKTIDVIKYSTWQYTTVSSISRILIGTIFGALLIISNKSGLILNIITNNFYLLYAFSFMCGFSERFFPELMQETNSI